MERFNSEKFQQEMIKNIPKGKIRYWTHILWEYNPFTQETRQVTNYLTFEKGVVIKKEEQELEKQKEEVKVNKQLVL